MMFKPESNLQNTLESWIGANEKAFFQDIAALVEIPSVSIPDTQTPFGEGCAQVLDTALKMAEEYGFSTENHARYCGTCTLAGSEKTDKKTIGFFTHLDVVPAGDGWSADAFQCIEQDGYLIGRGVMDNKGPAVSALYAMRFFKENGIPLKNDVMTYFGCAEETGMEDLVYYCKNNTPPDFALVPDNEFPVCFGEKGILRFRAHTACQGNLVDFCAGDVVNVVPAQARAVLAGISLETAQQKLAGFQVSQVENGVEIVAKGISKHAAFPEGSINALHILAKALFESGLVTGTAAQALQGAAILTADAYGESLKAQMEDDASGKLTCVGSVARVENGNLVLRFDVRYPVTASFDTVQPLLEKGLAAQGFTMTDVSNDPPAYISPDEPAIPLLCDIAEFVVGKPLAPYTMGGGTYARKLPRAVGFGPGVPGEVLPMPSGRGQGHQPDECARKSALLNGLRAYVYALKSLDEML